MLPVLAQIGPVTIYTHDFFTIAGLLVGLVWYYRSLLRDRILDQRIVLISLSALLGGVLGAHLLTSWEALGAVSAAGMPPTAILTHGPRSIIGGFVGAYVGVILAKRSLGYTLSTGDHYAAAIPLGLAIGRIGCFLSELPLGTPTTLPWGMTVSPVAATMYGPCPGCFGPMHPSMLYEIAFNLAAFALIASRGTLLPVRGDTVKAYLLAYAVFRFAVEFVRGNQVQAFGLTGPQLVLIPLAGLLALHFIRQLRAGVYRMPEPMPSATARRRT